MRRGGQHEEQLSLQAREGRSYDGESVENVSAAHVSN